MKLDVIVIGLLVAMVLFVGQSLAVSVCPFPADESISELPLHTSSVTASVGGQCIGVMFGSEYFAASDIGDTASIGGYSSSLLSTGVTQQAKETTINNGIDLSTKNALVLGNGGTLISTERFGGMVAGKNDGAPYNTMTMGQSGVILSKGTVGSELQLVPGENSLKTEYAFVSGMPDSPNVGMAWAYSGYREQTGSVKEFVTPIVVNETTGETVNQTEYRLMEFEDSSYNVAAEYIGTHILAFNFNYQGYFPAGPTGNYTGLNIDYPCIL